MKAEGYVHEWRRQRERGLWVTEQLISNVPLGPGEAAAVRDGGASPACAAAATPQVAPAGRKPAAGTPAGRAVGRHPEANTGDNTSHPPAGPAGPRRLRTPDRRPGPDAAATAEARALVEALPRLDPRLRVPRAMADELTGLVTRWLEAGHRASDVRFAVLRGLPGGDGAVRRPGGLVRYLLRDVPPGAVAPVPPPSESRADTRPRLSARLSRMRECAGDHVQARLFLPEGDEELCRQCSGHVPPAVLPPARA